MNPKELLGLTWLSVFIASLCCLTPIVLVLFGLSTLSFAVSVSNILDGQYRFIFVFAGLLMLIITLVMYFRKKGICTINQVVKHRNEVINKILLILIVSVVGYYLFFIVFLGYIGKVLGIWD